MLPDISMFVGGGVCVWLGAEGLVRGSVKLAAWLGIPSLVVGLTVMALGTSAPELVVSAVASYRGHGEIALGNVIGSNILNIGLVLGLSAVIAPLAVRAEVLRRDMPVLVGVTLAVALMAVLGDLFGRLDGVLLVALFLGYTLMCYRLALAERQRTTRIPGWERPALRWFHIAFLVGGTTVLAAGAEGMVRGAVGVAAALGVSERVLAVILVAFGTSLPELAASAVAARRGESDLALGNVFGSNIVNMTLILGISALFRPIPTNVTWRSVDMIFFVAMVLVLVPMARIRRRVGRIDGMILLAMYALALVLLIA
jgi:cation:H+ antiporter